MNYDEDEEHVSIFFENQDPLDVELEYQVYVVSQLKAVWYPKANGLFLISLHLFFIYKV